MKRQSALITIDRTEDTHCKSRYLAQNIFSNVNYIVRQEHQVQTAVHTFLGLDFRTVVVLQ